MPTYCYFIYPDANEKGCAVGTLALAECPEKADILRVLRKRGVRLPHDVDVELLPSEEWDRPREIHITRWNKEQSRDVSRVRLWNIYPD